MTAGDFNAITSEHTFATTEQLIGPVEFDGLDGDAAPIPEGGIRSDADCTMCSRGCMVERQHRQDVALHRWLLAFVPRFLWEPRCWRGRLQLGMRTVPWG